MDLVNIIIFLSAFANLFLGLLIYSKGSDKLINRVYALLAISIFIWSMGMVGYRATGNPAHALLWCRFLYAAAISMGGSFLLFTYVFPENKLPQRTLLFLILFFHFTGFFIMIFSNRMIVDIVIEGTKEHAITFAPLYYLLYIPLVLIAFAWGYINLLIKRARNKGIIRYQLTLVFLGAFLSSSFGMFTNLALPTFHIFSYNWLAQILAIIMAGCIAYAIVRYRFMDIRLIASRLYVYTIVGLFTYAFYYLFAIISERYLGGVFDARSVTLGALFAFVYAIIFIPLLNKIQSSSDILFYRGYNPQRIFKDLGLRLSSVIDLKQVLNILDAEFKQVLGSEDMNVILFKTQRRKRSSHHYLLTTCNPVFGKLEKSKIIKKQIACDILVKGKKIMVTEELRQSKHKKEARLLEKHNIAIVSPLIIRSKPIGVILLGEKISKSAYTKEDIDFLEVISSQAAIAIENARLHKEVGDYSRNLQRKVEVQTKDIQEKQEKLLKLLNMRSEFLDITSHQLRTPVSVIKGVLSMLEEGSVPKKRINEFLGMAFKKSLKLEQIVDEILRASEMDSEKFELNLGPVDIIPLIQEISSEKSPIAKRGNIKFELILPSKKVSPVLSDLKYLKHVIINLVNNSLQYTKKGSIKIIIKETRGRVIISIQDTGIGIPKKDIPKLYKKFSRANNAKETFTDGSGLGLYIVKQIINAHKKASIKIAKTGVGKGTTIVISLPISV